MPSIVIHKGRAVIVSPEDVSLVEGCKWTIAGRGQGYAYRMGKRGERQGSIYLHRVIVGAVPGQIVDHANRDTLDNRRENLRIATKSQNTANSTGRTPASGFRGVYKVRKIWRASIRVNNKTLHGGHFATREEAARRYDELARLHFGEFAVLNFPGADE